MAEFTFVSEARNNKIGYCLDIILTEAKKEDVLAKQLLYTMLSMYTNDPRNLAIQSPTGEGKNYVIKKVADLFPKEDVIKYVGMSDKSIFHKNGKLVIKNDNGEYEYIEEVLEKLDEDIEGKKYEISNTNDNHLKQGLKAQIKDLEKEKKRLYKDVKKLIDLSHKCIIFLDTPRPELLNAIMSLLSHDEYEVEYDFVDTNNGIKTRTNVLRGWPVVIFAQAVDFSHHKRYPEIQRRFVVTNPRMDQDKYKAAIELTVHKHSVPDFLYQKTIVSDEQKEQAREIVKGLKEKIIDISTTITPGSNNVFIPFGQAITEILATKKSSDMTVADRIVSFLTLVAQVNIEDRPFIIFRKKGDPITQRIPLATFADFKEALFLMQFSYGVRPYVLQWYNDVFVPTFDEKQNVDSKPSPDGKYIIEERIKAVTTQQLADATFNKTGKKISAKHIRETYIDQLINQGYVDSVGSQIDRRAEIYFPVIRQNQETIVSKLINSTQIDDTPFFVQSPIFPTQNDIRSNILALLEYADENTVLEIKNNNNNNNNNNNDGDDIDSILDRYYSNPEEVFHKVKDPTKKEPNDNDLRTEVEEAEVQVEAAVARKNILYQQDIVRKNIFSKSPDQIVYPNGARNEPHLSNGAEKYEIDGKKAYSPISPYSCYYCDGFNTNDEREYQSHAVINHPNKPAYPRKIELETFGLKAQGKGWEI